MTKKVKREIIEWSLFIVVVGGLYITGWHTEVLGTLQRGILATGIIRPDIEEDSQGKANYNFQLRDMEGNIHNVNDWKGEVIFINLWATWCPPCIAEMPDINNLYRVKGQDVRFVMISLDDDPEKAKQFIERKGFKFPVFTQVSGLPAVFHSNSIPTTFVIDQNGEIVVKRMGLAKYYTDDFKQFLDDLVSKKVSEL